MAKQIQYQVGFTADTSQLSATISKLRRELDAVTKLDLKISVPNSEIKAAANAAKELQTHLSKAINSNTGQLDLTKFNASIKASGQSVEQLSQKLLGAGQTGTQAFVSMAQAVGQAQVPIKQVNATLKSLATTLKNTVKWQLSSTLVHGLQSALAGALSYAKDLNTSLNKIQIVTGQSADQMVRFAEKANQAAKQLSTTTKAYTEAALIYYQQGDSDAMVEKKAAITTKAANVAFSASAKEMSDMLTAVWNSYKVGEDELQRYVDVMAALGATTATSTEEIATAMSKVAATANNVGVSMEQMSSIIATVSAVTRQSAESVGTSFKTMLARIGDLKLGGDDEDGVGLGKVSSQLKEIGVNVLDAEGNLRDMGSIIEDLGKKWGTMNKAQQQAVAQAVAGKRQYTQLMALMDNMDKYYQNLTTAANSQGTLDKQASIYAESWKAASARVQASLEEIYNKLLDDKAFIGVLNALNGIIGVVSKVIDGFGGLGGVILSIGSIASMVFEKQIATYLTQIPQKISNLTAAGRQQNLENSQNDLMAGINNVRDTDSLTESQNMQLNATEKIMQMNQQLSASAKQMSADQIAGAQAAIESYRQITEELIQQQQKIEETDTSINTLKQDIGDSFAESMFKQLSEDANLSGADIDAVRDKVRNFKDEQYTFRLFGDDDQTTTVTMTFDQIIEKAKEVSTQLAEAKKTLVELNTHTQSWGEDFQHINMDNLKEAAKDLEYYVSKAFDGVDDSKAAYLKSQLAEALKVDPSNIQTAKDIFNEVFNEVNTTLEDTKNRSQITGQQLGAVLDTFKDKIDPALIDELKQKIAEWGTANAEAGTNQDQATDALKRYHDELAKNKVTTADMVVSIFSTVTAMTALTKGCINLGKTWSSNKPLGEKLLSTLSLMPSLLMAAKAATGLYEKSQLKKAIADEISATGSLTAAGGVRAFTTALLESPLLPVILILMALAAAFTAVSAALNADNERKKEASKIAEEHSKAIQEEIDEQKKEREELQKTYNAWEQLEDARDDATDASDEYISATDSVLEALDMEQYKVLITLGKYNELAEAIKRANNERINANAINAKSSLSESETAATTYAGTFKNDDNQYITSSGVWDNRFVLYNAADKFKNQWDSSKFGGLSFEQFYSQKMGFTGSKDSGFNDIRFNGSSATDLEEAYKTALELETEFGEALTSLPVWKEYKTWLENSGGLVYNARENSAQAMGAGFMLQNYGTDMSVDQYNRGAMVKKVMDYLVSQNVMAEDDPRLKTAAEEIVDSYVESLGDAFVEAANNAKASEIVEDELRTNRFSDEGIAALRQNIKNAGYDPDAVLAANTSQGLMFAGMQYQIPEDQLSNPGSYTAGQAQYMSKAAIANYAAQQASSVDLTLGQRLFDAESLAGTFEKKPENKAEIEKLFNEYYTDEKERTNALAQFWAQSAEGQVQILEEMSQNAEGVIKETWQTAKDEAIKAKDEAAEAGLSAIEYGYNSGQLSGLNMGWTENEQKALEEAAKNNDTATIFKVNAGKSTAVQAEIDARRKKWNDYIAGTGEYKDQGEHTAEEAAKEFGYTLEDLDQMQSELDAITMQTESWATIVKKSEEDWSKVDTSITKSKTALKDFNSLTSLVKQSAVDTAAEWSKLSETTGKSIATLKAEWSSMSKTDWANTMITNAETQFGNMISASQAKSMSDKDIEAAVKSGKAFVSDAEYAEAEQKLQAMREERDQIIYDVAKESIDKELEKFSKMQSALQSVDLNNLPVDETTESYKNLAAALQLVNVDMDTFAGQNRVQQLETLRDAENAVYEEQLKQQDALIAAKEAQLENAKTTEQRSKLESELTTLKSGQTTILEKQQSNSAKYAKSIASEYKTEVTAAVKTAEAAVTKLNTKISEGQSLAQSMASALSDGSLSYETLEKLADFDSDYGTNFAQKWNEASTAMQRAAIASEMYQQAITASAQKQTEMTSAVQELGNADIFAYAGSQDELYTFLGTSNLSDTAKSLVTKAYSNISGQIYEGMSQAEITKLLSAEITKLVNESKDATDELMAQYKTTMKGIFKDLAQQEKTQAQSVVDTWTSAFETIKKAKLKVAEGGSLAELFAGDAASINTILTQLIAAGKTLQEAKEIFYNGGSELQNLLSYDQINQNQQLLAAGYGLVGGSVDTSGKLTYAGSYEEAKQAWVESHMADYETDHEGYETAAEAAAAAFKEEFSETMKSLGFNQTEIEEIIGGKKWDVVGTKLETFSTATEMASEALVNFAKVEQAKAERDTTITENKALAEKAESYASAAFSAQHRESGTSVAESIASSGVSRADFAAEAVKQLGLTDVDLSTDDKINEFLNGLTEDQLSSIYDTEKTAAEGFYSKVTEAADAFLAKFNEGGELDFKGNAAAKKDAKAQAEDAHKTANTQSDTTYSTETAQDKKDLAKVTTNRTASLSSMYSNGPQSAADYTTLIEAGIAGSAEEIRGMDRKSLREKISTAMTETLNNTVSESMAKTMSAEDLVGKNIVTDTDYAKMQDDQMALNATAATEAYTELNTSIQHTLTSVTTLGTTLSKIDLDKMPLKGSKAWEALDADLRKCGTSLEEFQKLSREDQIKQLGSMQTGNLNTQISLYDQLIAEAQNYANDEKLSEKARAEWAEKAIELTNTRASLVDQVNAQELATVQQLSQYYEAEYDKIAKRQAELTAKADKTYNRASTLSGAVLTGDLTMKQQASLTDDQIAKWNSLATAEERARYAVELYTQSANEAMAARDETLTNITGAQNALSTLIANAFTTAEGTVSKDAFTNMLKDMDIAPALKGELEKAWDSALGNLSADDLNNLSWADVGQKLKDELVKNGELAEEELAEKIGEIHDAMISTYSELSTKELELADKVVNAWRTAFDKIAALRKTIISGEGIADVLLGDVDSFVNAVNAWTGEGGVKGLVEQYKAGKLNASDFTLGTPEEYAARLKRDFGMEKLFDNHGMAIKGTDTDALAAKFGITKDQFTTNGVLDEDAYSRAVQKATEPYLKQLLSKAGYQDFEIESIMDQYWDGSDTAVKLIQDAGHKMNEVADEYAKLYIEDKNLKEKQTETETKIANLQKDIETQSTEQSKALAMRDVAYDMAETEGYYNQMDVIAKSGYSKEDILAEINKTRGENNQASDISQITDDEWREFALQMDEQAAANQEEIARLDNEVVALWEQFRALLAEKYGDDHEYVKAVDEKIEAAKQTAQEAQEQANAAAENVTNNALDSFINSSGMAKEAFMELMQSISDESGSLKDVEEMTQDEQIALAKLALRAAECANAWTNLTSKQADNISMIKKGEKANVNYLSGLRSVMNDVKTIFGNSKAVTEDFVESNIGLIEDMSNGVEGAAEKLEEQVLRAEATLDGWDYDKEIEVSFDVDNDGLTDQLSTIGEILNNFGDQHINEPVGFTATLDNTPAIEGLNALLSAGDMTVEQMNAALADIGWEPEIEYVPITWDEAQHATGTMYAQDSEGNYYQVSADTKLSENTQYYLPKIKSAKKTGGGASSGVKPTSSNTSSGGGGGSKETKEHKKFDDEVDRYHTINEQLDLMSKKLTQIDKLKTRTYGQAHLKELDAEIGALKDQIALNEEKLQQAKEYLAQDKARMAANRAQFNSDGTIANYEAMLQSWIDEYNAAVDAYNESEQNDADKDIFEDAEDLYEDRLDWLSKYEESLETVADQENQILELQNKISAANLEKITYVVELKTTLNESDRKMYDYFMKKMEDSLTRQNEHMETLIKKNNEYEHDLAVTRQAIADLEEQHRLWEESGGMDGINDADYATQLQTYRDQLTSTLSSMYDNMEKIKDAYKDALSVADTELQKYTKVIDHAISLTSEFIDILGLMGKKVPYEDLENFYNAQYEGGLKQLEVNKAYVASLKSEMEYFEKIMAKGQELTETQKEQYNDLKDSFIEAENTLVSNTKTVLTNLQNAHKAHIAAIMEDLSKVNVGTYNDIQMVSDAYSRWNEAQSNYLNAGKQVYEINKLNRKIEDSIADAGTKASSARLKALQDEINLKAKSGKLTEYQIQQFEYQYELVQAMEEMEEARDAKSTVRLVRDEEGNYGYQYTADQDSLDEAEQHYEDILEKIRELTETTADQMAQGYINARVKMEQELAALDESDFSSHEEYLKARDEIVNYYTGQMEYYAEQYGIVVDDMSANLNAIQNHYSAENVQASEMMKQSLNEDISAMINNHDEYVDAVATAIDEINTENDDYIAKIDEVKTASGLDFADMNTSIDEWGKRSDTAKNKAIDVTKELQKELDKINDTTNAWDSHKDALDSVIESYEDLIEDLGEVLDLLQQIEDDSSTSTPTSAGPTSDYTSPTTTSTPTSSTPTSSTPTSSTPTSSTPSDTHTHNKNSQMYVGSERHYKCSICGKDMGPVEGTVGSQQTQTQSHGACFAPGTQIMMADGSTKAIEDIKLGDYVTSYNIETGKFESQEVIQLFTHTTERLMRVTLIDGTKLDLTPSHPILTLGGWRSRDLLFSMLEEHVEAKWLEESDIVIKYEANVGIASIEELDIPNDYVVYNFKVDNTHTYIAEGVVVHNMVTKYASGGLADYTGPAWVDGTKTKPEYVLNADQTASMFDILNSHIIENMLGSMREATIAMVLGTQFGLSAHGVAGPTSEELMQEVHITAEFPNATNHSEIEEAFSNLINQTTQYIHRQV